MAGQLSTLNGAPISTRACGAISDAYLYATTPHMFSGETEAAFNRVRDAGKQPIVFLNQLLNQIHDNKFLYFCIDFRATSLFYAAC